MTGIDYKWFTERWLERADRVNEEVDITDKFISLWIAFNGWMRRKFGEDKRDNFLIKSVIELNEIKNVFNDLKDKNSFSENLGELGKFTVKNMRFPDDENNEKKYDGSFKSLIWTIYNVRCNLIHGRKDPQENKKDLKLICISYNILKPLFNDYIEKYGYY